MSAKRPTDERLAEIERLRCELSVIQIWSDEHQRRLVTPVECLEYIHTRATDALKEQS